MTNINLFKHNSIKLLGNINIYIDPYEIDDKYNDADIIFITHNHYDHFSIKDILKIKNENTIIVSTKDTYDELIKYFDSNKIIIVNPNNSYDILDISFETVRAYNINKSFHPIDNDWVGYIINIDNTKYYIMGDTDINDDVLKVKCDVLFIPIGGTYTMNYKEAASYTNTINPKIVIPTHYGLIVGDAKLGQEFKSLINDNISCEIYIK